MGWMQGKMGLFETFAMKEGLASEGGVTVLASVAVIPRVRNQISHFRVSQASTFLVCRFDLLCGTSEE